MLAQWLVAVLLITRASGSPDCVESPPDPACACPPGTERVLQAPTEKAWVMQGAVSEEACWKRLPSGSRVRQGPCIVRGPNGEHLAEGEFNSGLKSGWWHYWTPSQEREHYWTAGRIDSTRNISTPRSFSIDFCSCLPQAGMVYWTFGSCGWSLLEAGSDSCRIRTWVEYEQAYSAQRQYCVPRTMGLRTFDVPAGRTIDFSPLEPYFRGLVRTASNSRSP